MAGPLAPFVHPPPPLGSVSCAEGSVNCTWCNCRIASHNPFAGSRNGEYHSLSAVRRDTSGDSSSFVPNRSSLSVPALVLPVKGGALRADNEMTGDDRRRTTESLLWENEPMSTAAAVGSSSSSGKRTSRNSMDAVSCVWENEPMSAAATLSSVPRLTLQRVSEAAEGQLDGRSVEDDRADFAALGASRLAGGEKVRIALPISSARSGVLGLRPHRQAPLPPVLRSNSFPSHDQDEGYLEFEVTSGLTLKETPRSQRRRDVQRGSWSRQTSLTGQAVGVSEPAHAGTSGSPHVSFALPALSQGQQANADADIPLQSSTSAEVAAVIASIMPPQHVDLQTSAAALHPDAKQMQYAGHGDAAAQSAVVPDTTEQNAGQVPVDVMSRHASVITLYESAHSGVLSDSGDVVTAPDGVILS